MKKVFYFLSKASAFVKSFLKRCVSACWFLFVQVLAVCMATASWCVIVDELQYFHSVNWFSFMGAAQFVVHVLLVGLLVWLGLFGILFLLSEAVFIWAFIQSRNFLGDSTDKKGWLSDLFQ